MMRILGIDPGLANVGWGILDKKGSRYMYVQDGTIVTDSCISLKDRLKLIFDDLVLIIDKFKPNVASIEDIYFAKNKKTAIRVAEARGAIILTLALQNVDFYEYTPIQVKNSISGFGRLKKVQVKYVMRILLGMNPNFIFNSDHSSDALALAICHGNHRE
ncbi:crossover junction endodeoxyribonuclease RuvC [Borrelia miyamotoi]|uniref:Crossover junction endodeoxyribonuclease RuvC n=1 Tax=Borrelia miyamotoi TaxID=47466 RepID=A0AAP8YW44_9SPIR|nr:crossover junction endodeoxyribonuclease RuvC [Borrelia miyamotoi]ATQ15149.1 crossover junction endodeoxyribonuclease RuvC [Borrelia miyamotoi]ATQ16331.1 crossover junction endodeoxyribonuclease RuvC [Borrelia miyamotoi]ATQ17474.1 crossover junction endodeoxyribonuclease RuvC [Borrelia miyamotoi]ATQ18023.1 crossover junction endodeoxyribonuclease RuvC [Borrelia miyamotoi]ATQ19971.1 crossover junction endodeoxyribonuclease RuvC [Borrelia miyamotoi]